ncbi:MAG: NAD(P)-dependent oxidoreductase, partial [Polyangiaceae bacterium]
LMSAPQAVASGKLVSAAGDGKVGYVTRRDCARAAAAALAEATGTQTLDVTGPALVGQTDVAELLSNLAGTTIEVVPVSGEALCAGMVEHGVPEPVAALMVSIDAAIAKGTLAVTSTAVRDLTGTEATSVEQFLRANAEMISGASS